MASCDYCRRAATDRTPNGPVCQDHAIEYFASLIAFVAARRRDPGWQAECAEVSRVTAEWHRTTPIDRPFVRLRRDAIIRALLECNWVQAHAAERLGMSPRKLHYHMKRLGIVAPPIRDRLRLVS